VGKRIVDQSTVPSGDVDYPVENVVYKSQLPPHVVLIKQDVDHTAITGAVKSGLSPILLDQNDIVVHTY
jgi:hypothetical protein